MIPATSDFHDGPRETTRRDWIVFAVCLGVLVALMLARANFGMEWLGDDAYTLSTAMRYVEGDRPVVDSWETHFSSDMLVTPVVWVIHQVSPDWTGLVRYYRYAFVLLQALYAFLVWRLLRGLLPPPLATLTALTAFAYLPYYYVLLNYNSITIAAFTLSVLCLYRAFSRPEPSRGLVVAAGIASAVAVIVYPTMLLAIPFFLAGIWAVNRAHARRPLLWYLGGLFVPLGVFAVLTLIWAGPKFREALPWFLSFGDRDSSFAAVFGRFNRTRAVTGAMLASTITFLILWFVRRSASNRAFVAIVGSAIASVVVAIASPNLPGHTLLYYMDIPQACAFGIGITVPLLAVLSDDAFYRRLFWILYLPTLGMLLGSGVASLEGFETATMPAVIGLVGAVLALDHAARVSRSADSGTTANRTALIVVGLVLALFVVTDVWYFGGDSTLIHLTARIEDGAYAGVRTTPENARLYAHYRKVFAPATDSGGRVAFVEAFPTGYLITGRIPGAYSVWSNFTTGPRWQAYLDITGNYPTTIVSTRVPGPNGGQVPQPFAPPMGLRDFDKKYVEIYRDQDFAIYRLVRR